jgi:hypothetical protein
MMDNLSREQWESLLDCIFILIPRFHQSSPIGLTLTGAGNRSSPLGWPMRRFLFCRPRVANPPRRAISRR